MNQCKFTDDYIVFHHNDLDGYSAAFLAAYLVDDGFRNKTRKNRTEHFVYCDHSHHISTDMITHKDQLVIIVDYSFTGPELDTFEDIISKTDNIVWIDHHKSSIELEEQNPKYKDILGIRNTCASGAALTYEYFTCLDIYESTLYTIPLWIQYVSDYDTWTHKLKDSNRFKYGMDSEDMNPWSSVYYDLMDGFQYHDSKIKNKPVYSDSLASSKVREYTLNNIIDHGRVIEIFKEKEYERFRKDAYKVDVDGFDGIAINAHGNSFIFGDLIKSYDICVLYYFDGLKYVYSLYSDQERKDPIDCSLICAKHGGGGHAGAAGFASVEKVW